MPISINLDLRKLGRIPGMKTLGKAMNAAGTAMDKVDHTLDAAGSPIKTSRARACTVECDAPAGARLLRADARGSQTNDLADWRFDLQLSDGRRVTVDERTPHLVLLRLFPGAPIAVLVSPEGDVAVDWEATLRYPDMRQPATG